MAKLRVSKGEGEKTNKKKEGSRGVKTEGGRNLRKTPMSPENKTIYIPAIPRAVLKP